MLAAYGIPVTTERPWCRRGRTEPTLSALSSFRWSSRSTPPTSSTRRRPAWWRWAAGRRRGPKPRWTGCSRSGAQELSPAPRSTGFWCRRWSPRAVAECIVGMKKDPQFGPTVLFGLGGIFVEVFEDIALRVAPLAAKRRRDDDPQTKGYQGCWRVPAGARKADLAALEDVLLKMSRPGPGAGAVPRRDRPQSLHGTGREGRGRARC